MANIKPFCGFRFSRNRIKNLEDVLCPPYDVINNEQRKGFIKKSRYNIVNIVLPEGNKEDKYTNAKKRLNLWIKSGILIPDAKPCIYVYAQEFKVDGLKKKRFGFICLLEIDKKYKEGILPHEKVFEKPLTDRLNLMKATRAHLSPIFMLFRDTDKRIKEHLLSAIRKEKPVLDVTINGVREILWRVNQKRFIKAITLLMRKEKVFIADGHHRFEASVLLKKYMRRVKGPVNKKMPYDYTMVYFIDTRDKGLKVLPTHRAIKVLPPNFSIQFMKKRLSQYFHLKTFKNSTSLFKALRDSLSNAGNSFGFFYAGQFLLASLKNKKALKEIAPADSYRSWTKLDVSLLHYIILSRLLDIKERVEKRRNIYYYRGKNELIRRVKSGEFKMAVFLNPTKVKDVEEVAEAGERMPHKSTYFYPKLLTGLTLHKF